MANIVTLLPTVGAITVLPSAARTANPDTQEYELPKDARGLHLITDVTAIVTAPSITVSILGVDRVSAKTYVLLAGVAITTVSTQVLRVGPALTAAANSVANDYLPEVIRISVSHGNANSITYSIGMSLCQ